MKMDRKPKNIMLNAVAKCRPDGTIVAKLKYRLDGISLKVK